MILGFVLKQRFYKNCNSNKSPNNINGHRWESMIVKSIDNQANTTEKV